MDYLVVVLLQKSGMNITKNKKNLNPLFIGFGNQALEYANVLRFLNIRISGVCITDLKKNIKNLKKYNVENVYLSINKAIKEKKFNSVFVFLPWNIIEKKIIFILKNTNKRIFCEKPIALSYKNLLKIEKLSRIYNKNLFILYNRRYFKIISYLKKRIYNQDSFEVVIPEKRSFIINNIDKNLDGYIKFHLTSHWIDFFMFLFQKKKIFKVKNFDYISEIHFKNRSKKSIIRIIYDGQGRIDGKLHINRKEYKIKTLEKLFIKTKDKKEKILINEKKLNKFKPGVLNLINDIISNGKTKLPRPQDLKNMYKFLEKLPY